MVYKLLFSQMYVSVYNHYEIRYMQFIHSINRMSHFDVMIGGGEETGKCDIKKRRRQKERAWENYASQGNLEDKS